MLLNFLLMQRNTWFVPFVLQAIAYVGVLRKMGIPVWWAVIPGGADFQLTKRLSPGRGPSGARSSCPRCWWGLPTT